jgi:hypothetical protein
MFSITEDNIRQLCAPAKAVAPHSFSTESFSTKGRRANMEDELCTVNLPMTITSVVLADIAKERLRELHTESLRKFLPRYSASVPLRAGSCVNGAIINPNGQISCVNIGDSRTIAFIVKPDNSVTALPLHKIHNSGYIQERERIENHSSTTICYTHVMIRDAEKNRDTVVTKRGMRKWVGNLKDSGMKNETFFTANYYEIPDTEFYWMSNELLGMIADGLPGYIFFPTQRVLQNVDLLKNAVNPGGISVSRSICSSDCYKGAGHEAEVTTLNINDFKKPEDRVYYGTFCDGYFENAALHYDQYAILLSYHLRNNPSVSVPELFARFAYHGLEGKRCASGDNLSFVGCWLHDVKGVSRSQWVCDAHGDIAVATFLKQALEKLPLVALQKLSFYSGACQESVSVAASSASIASRVKRRASSSVTTTESMGSTPPDKDVADQALKKRGLNIDRTVSKFNTAAIHEGKGL